MLLNNKISNAPETAPALDQRQLHAIGLEHIRSLSHRVWTDHNIHDPGITILELLCYTLTDLAYRAGFPVNDLLATPVNDGENMKQQFFTPRQIMPNKPLTTSDYRKLLIDLDCIKNAWIRPMEECFFLDTIKSEWLDYCPFPRSSAPKNIHEVSLQGLYKVFIEIEPLAEAPGEASSEEVASGQASAEASHPQTLDDVKLQVMQVLQANRNLCEDFVSVDTVQDQYYTLCVELDLTPDADQNEVAARIQFEVEQYLTPPVMNNTLADMLARKHEDGTPYTIAEIFEGPRLDHGFIDDAELEKADLRTEIRLSDIISIIMDIDGVLAVRDIIINPQTPGGNPNDPAEPPTDKWRIKVPAGRQPRLSDQNGRLLCYKRNMPAPLNENRFRDALQKLKDALASWLDTENREDLPIPAGRYRDTGAYRSFQQYFPVLYGLSDQGLPSGADERRKALALQLKGYLLFFDQVMSDYLAQLANVRELFSRKPSVDATYFARLVESFPDAAHIYADGFSSDDLTGLLESNVEALSRRERFLDHLLARVAENFHHYVGIMRSAFEDYRDEEVVAMKYNFLNACPELGAERSLASNYTLKKAEDLWNSPNVSGLERRLARLLDIRNFTRRRLSTIPHDIYPEVDQTPGDEFRFRIKHTVSGKILLSSSMHYVTEDDARAEMNDAIDKARSLQNYQCKITHDGKHYFNIINDNNEVIARRIEYFTTLDAMNAAIETLINFMKVYRTENGEGMYVIENILLRPQLSEDPFLPVCVDPNCTDCAEADPYSYRLHFILPAYAGRFQKMEFRRFVEETIRTETPAHILPKVCWIGPEDMAKVEAAYHDFLSLISGADTSSRLAKLTALTNVLTEVKNVYPAQLLRGCDSLAQGQPFALGRSALGSTPPTSPPDT